MDKVEEKEDKRPVCECGCVDVWAAPLLVTSPRPGDRGNKE